MARSYVKLKRAEKEAETRLRIVEATVALHSEIGPARTTISMIAERAGVQRHTVYAHFPDERSIHLACSGHHMERNPLPSPDEWSGVKDPMVRMQTALAALYDWYARNSSLMSSVLRDAEVHQLTREVTELRAGPGMRAITKSLSGCLAEKGKGALAVAISFHTWHTLTQVAGLKSDAAVGVMARAVLDADR